ncbi:nitrate ABC transporter ATP-binding protein [Mycobacterium vulneris]|uniref:ABC transporter ATP-binding protein n=1 Tax=Mycolicibacterium porcinum TaxID=39693 RepID=A0AAW5T2I7_9MYCO|nr:ABC transporter ATP-binding protein [Mycolicibacterium porcinum]OCB50319.1 nitrate ABC transporter ATP-binding protein [Mycolicibacterium vulneris]MCV7389079.1 ABC transporter ATP-binding protein [Mycolicibacterium porcinum]OCB56666.1 nitrate ABC transporter ATP-binding protein [Mycolicibacterium vulneris]OCB60876.1 nitrate ABC transporter ATP-binding protein [Mycolicibacterium vulneris]ORB44627.1 nitrate ABC transporter ATP-binding protein [Mycolicibacterium porcinum]
MGTHALRIAHGTRNFGGAPALTDLDLQIRTGEFLAVLGPSGSGKSTLLRICAGLDDLSSGTLTWSGDGSRPRTGVVFQQPLLMPWLSVADNVAFARRFAAQRSGFDADDAAKLITRFGLDHLAARYPDELSGGQAQRVAILRAVATRPQLLLLDEPFSALDPATRTDLVGWLRELARELDVTVVLVTHDVDEALSLAQRIVLLDGGRIRADWTVGSDGTPTRGEILAQYRADAAVEVL